MVLSLYLANPRQFGLLIPRTEAGKCPYSWERRGEKVPFRKPENPC